jgi:hypothetical protein
LLEVVYVHHRDGVCGPESREAFLQRPAARQAREFIMESQAVRFLQQRDQ